jgi:tetratricopeptide (TPR) repeat protein
MRIAAVIAVAVALLTAGVARADEAGEARQHYKAATGHFAVGEFDQAATEYEAAFKLHQDPALLFNAAQSRRLAGQNQRALVLYKNFLNLYPDSKQAPTVREQIGKLQEVIAAEEKAKAAPPTNTVEAHGVGEQGTQQQAQPTPPPPQPEAQQQAQPQAQQTPPQPAAEEKPPIYKKWWFWTAIGVVVVAAVVIPVAVVESSSKWSNLPDQGPGATASRVATHPMLEVRW